MTMDRLAPGPAGINFVRIGLILLGLALAPTGCATDKYTEYADKLEYSGFTPELVDRFYSVENTAIFPFNNYSGIKNLHFNFYDMIQNKISVLELGNYFSTAPIIGKLYKDTLIVHNTLSNNYKIQTARRYDCDFIFTGSITECRASEPFLLSVNFQLLDTRDRAIIWVFESELEGRTLDLRNLGITRLNTVSQLMQVAIDQAFADFYRQIEPAVIESITLKKEKMRKIMEEAQHIDIKEVLPEQYEQFKKLSDQQEQEKDPLLSLKILKQAELLLESSIKEAKYILWMKKYAKQ